MLQSSYIARLALLHLFTLHSFTHAICYFPDGITVATNDVPCEGSDKSACCGPGFACLSNHICKWTEAVAGTKPNTLFFRGSCTDPTFNSENCPLFCLGPGETPNGGIGISQCPNSETLFYCQGDKHVEAAGNCSATNPQTPPLIIFASAATTVTVIGVKTTTSASSTITTTSVSTTITTTSDTSTSTGGAATSITSSSPSPASTSSSSGSSDLPLAIGAGVGIPLSLLVIAAVGWIVFRVRRIKKKDKAAQTAAAWGAGGMNPAHGAPPMAVQHGAPYEQYAAPKYQDTSDSFATRSPYARPQHPAELSERDAVELQ